MPEISFTAIILTVVTIALISGLSPKKRKLRSGKTKKSKLYINDITSLPVTAEQIRRFREDKSPVILEVNILGKSDATRRNRIASLSPGSVLYVAWTGRDSRKNGWVYSILFVDSLENVYATARDEDKEALANRFDYIRGAFVVEIDRDVPRLVIEVSFG